MRRFCLIPLFVVVAALAISTVQAQSVVPDDRPKLYVPLRPPTQKEINHRESLKLYVYGLLCENDDRLIEALKAYEQAAKLDPDAAAIYKAQVPILITLDRGDDALDAIAKVVDLDPADYESWYIRARLFKALGKLPEARAALQKGVAIDELKDHPEQAHQMYFELGVILESEKSYKQAAEVFQKAARILEHPEHSLELGLARDAILGRIAEVYERIGHLHRKAGQFDQAVAAFRKAQESFPAAAGRINFNLAQVLIEQGNFAQALIALDGYLRFQPQGLEAYNMKIDLLEKTSKKDQIVTWLEQASQVDQNNIGLKLLLADRLAMEQKNVRAEAIYLDMCDKAPDAAVYRGLLKCYKREGPPGVAKVLKLADATFDKAAANADAPVGSSGPALQAQGLLAALRDESDLSLALLQLALQWLDRNDESLKFQTVHYLAVAAERQRRNDDAERLYRQCLRSKSLRPTSEVLVYEGLLRVLGQGKKYESIIQVCKEGLVKAQAANATLFHSYRARALASLERYNEALADINEGIKKASHDRVRLQLQFIRVSILSQAGKHKEAEALCLSMLDDIISPGDMMDIRHRLSSVYSADKQMAKAEEQLQLILNLDPTNAVVNNDLGYIWADQNKNLKQAEELIRKAIEQERRQRKLEINLDAADDHDHAAYIDSLGWVLFRQGQIDEARKELERATKLLPEGDDSVIWDHLGDVYYRLQQYPQAQNAWQRALQLLEQERRNQRDERYQDLQRKLKNLTKR